MKLRTTHNSIRIRIRKSELLTLQQYLMVEESISFPQGVVFKFALTIENQLDEIKASLKDNVLTLSISKAKAKDWIESDQVGIETSLPISEDDQLHLLIEKDFPCLDRPNEDKSDTFWELVSAKPDNC